MWTVSDSILKERKRKRVKRKRKKKPPLEKEIINLT
jgi:hypothetical protein